MKQRLNLLAGIAALMLVSGAAGAAPTTTTQVGKTTQQAMELQRSGRQSVETRPMLKDVADRTYDRYLESFTHPIPDQYQRESSFSSGN